MKNSFYLFVFIILVTCLYRCKQREAAPPSEQFIVTANIDSSVKPGDNFYMYVNGKWMKNAVIPATESSVGSFTDIYNLTKDHLHLLLDSVAKSGFQKGSIAQKVGDFYASGMDSATIDKLGILPIQPYLKQIDSFKNAQSVLNFEAEVNTFNHSYITAIGVGPDARNSAVNILIASQAGLGLPDRDYYFKTDAASQNVQDAYKNYIRKLLTLIGNDSSSAVKKASEIYALEKDMAASHKTRVARRDAKSNYHKIAVAFLDKQMPLINWENFLKDCDITVDSINVQQPDYYIKLNSLLASTPVDVWKAYYAFHLTSDFADALSSDFETAQFDYNKSLTGQQKMRPRWQRIYRAVDNNLGEALGELYVKKYFTKDAKDRMLSMVNNLQKAFSVRIQHVAWMSDSTKKTATEKLNAFIKKIGFPDKWRDYSKVTINRNTYFDNIISCAKNEYQYELNKLEKPVDKTEWGMTPPTINAYYSPLTNEITFPAGILQLPFFDMKADDAINYGAIGMVIGHEMTHGFDDNGSQYDKNGTLKNWWTHEDSVQFVLRTKKIINQFNAYKIQDTMHVNGSLTIGENSADLGGLSIAYDAFKLTKEGQDTQRTDGFTPDQRFFISYAQVWRAKTKPELERTLINVDPHSPDEWRVNGPLSNFTPFYNAFNVRPGDKMYKPESERIKIW